MVSKVMPFEVCGEVVHGFGRGSKDLGVPTANLDKHAVETVLGALSKQYGIYYGWAWFENESELRFPMVMSFGCNPHYGNLLPSVEAHLLHEFLADFYGARLCLRIEGFIREEMKFSKLDLLIDRIKEDISFARSALKITK